MSQTAVAPVPSKLARPPMGVPHLLAIEGVSVSFDGFKAIDDLNVYIEKDEIRAIIGPNGAGKTTLLDLISGRTIPTTGHIAFKGTKLTGMLEYQIVRAGLGRKFQTPSVHEALTVFENLEMSFPDSRSWFSAWRFRRTPAIVAKVEQIAETIYLKDRLHHRAGLLSHGQKQWLEIGALSFKSRNC